jgi:hypothetical protein
VPHTFHPLFPSFSSIFVQADCTEVQTEFKPSRRARFGTKFVPSRAALLSSSSFLFPQDRYWGGFFLSLTSLLHSHTFWIEARHQRQHPPSASFTCICEHIAAALYQIAVAQANSCCSLTVESNSDAFYRKIRV